MFEEWGFLLAEIWALLVMSGVVGLAAGWMIWAGREPAASGSAAEAVSLREDLERCRALNGEKDDRIRSLEAEISALRAAAVTTSPQSPAPEPPRTREPIKPSTLAAARAGGQTTSS